MLIILALLFKIPSKSYNWPINSPPRPIYLPPSCSHCIPGDCCRFSLQWTWKTPRCCHFLPLFFQFLLFRDFQWLLAAQSSTGLSIEFCEWPSIFDLTQAFDNNCPFFLSLSRPLSPSLCPFFSLFPVPSPLCPSVSSVPSEAINRCYRQLVGEITTLGKLSLVSINGWNHSKGNDNIDKSF